MDVNLDKIYRKCKSTGLMDLLMSRTKKELDDLRTEYGVKNASHLSKYELAGAISDIYHKAVSKKIYMIEEEGYGFLRKLHYAGGKITEAAAHDLYTADNLRQFGLCFPVSIGENRMVVMPAEMSLCFAEAEERSLDETAAKNTVIGNLIQGLIKLYGLIDSLDLHRIIDGYMGMEIKSDRLFSIYYYISRRDGLLKMLGYYFVSDFCGDPKELYDEQETRDYLDYKIFPIQYVLENSNPVFVSSSPCVEAMERLLMRSFGINREVAMLHMAIISIDIIRDIKLQETLDYLGHEFMEWPEDFLGEFAKAYQNLTNNTPKWVLKGHTPNEVSGMTASDEHEIQELPMRGNDSNVININTGRN